MGFGDAFGNLGSSVKGMFTDGAGEKALLFIPNPSYYETFTTDNAALNSAADELEKDLLKRAHQRMSAATIKSTLGSGLKSFGQVFVPGSNSPDHVGEIYSENDNFIKVQVQYNPASIRMDSLNGKSQKMSGSDEASRMLQKKEFVGRTKLSFDLIFDDVDLTDSFMLQELTSANVTKGLNKVGSMYSHGGNTYSVTAKMEAMLSLLSMTASQQVLFFWGKMSFRGMVTGVNNTYMMFNTNGNPVRGKMHLDITQDNKDSDKFEYANTQWEESFKSVFGSNDGSYAGQSALSAITNNALLNF